MNKLSHNKGVVDVPCSVASEYLRGGIPCSVVEGGVDPHVLGEGEVGLGEKREIDPLASADYCVCGGGKAKVPPVVGVVAKRN